MRFRIRTLMLIVLLVAVLLISRGDRPPPSPGMKPPRPPSTAGTLTNVVTRPAAPSTPDKMDYQARSGQGLCPDNRHDRTEGQGGSSPAACAKR
jgi:hypothetical protein